MKTIKASRKAVSIKSPCSTELDHNRRRGSKCTILVLSQWEEINSWAGTESRHSGAMAGGEVPSPIRLEGKGEMAFPVETKPLASQPVCVPGASFAFLGGFVRSYLQT